jgi:hypothetical protein
MNRGKFNIPTNRLVLYIPFLKDCLIYDLSYQLTPQGGIFTYYAEHPSFTPVPDESPTPLYTLSIDDSGLITACPS